MIYAGSPAQHLPLLTNLIVEKLRANHRCLYLNSPSMVAGIRSYLAAAGLDVNEQTRIGALVLSSSQDHLEKGRFHVNRMLGMLTDAMHAAKRDGYAGLWASGDMSWEMGSEKNVSKLFEYECLLEKTLRENAALCGVCQYHIDTLPSDVVQEALYTHQAVYVNQTLCCTNPYYVAPEALTGARPVTSANDLQKMLAGLR